MDPLLYPVTNATAFPSHAFWCPGCQKGHGVNLNPAFGQPLWTLTGTLEKPTVRASVLVRSEDEKGPTVCHLFITDGQIRYLDDCTHNLRGKTVPMEPF